MRCLGCAGSRSSLRRNCAVYTRRYVLVLQLARMCDLTAVALHLPHGLDADDREMNDLHRPMAV